MIRKLAQLSIFSILVSPFYNAMAIEVGGMNENVFNVYVPNPPSSNEYSAGIFFLRPGGSNDYAVLVNPFNPNVADPILSPFWTVKGMDPDFSPGFSLSFRHNLAHSGSYINFHWAHLNTSDGATFPVNRQPPPAQQMTGPFWDIGPDAGTTSAARGRLKSQYDVLNAEVGKYVNLDPDFKMRIFTGISALWLHQNITANFSGTDPIYGFYTLGISTKSKFNSAGMRLGLDGEYQAWRGLNIVGLLAGNLYIGSEQPTTTTFGTGSILSNAGIPTNNQGIFHDSYIQLVPALDAKLGLKYSGKYAYNKSFALEAGYMASIYVNAIQNYVPSTYVPGSLGIVSGGIYLQSLLKATESFSLDGPYATFSIKI